MHIAYYAVDFSCGFFLPSHVVNETACVEVSLVVAHVIVHGALAGRLVRVEIAFNKKPRYAVFQYAEITEIPFTVIFCVPTVALSVEINIAAYVHACCGVI